MLEMVHVHAVLVMMEIVIPFWPTHDADGPIRPPPDAASPIRHRRIWKCEEVHGDYVERIVALHSLRSPMSAAVVAVAVIAGRKPRHYNASVDLVLVLAGVETISYHLRVGRTAVDDHADGGSEELLSLK